MNKRWKRIASGTAAMMLSMSLALNAQATTIDEAQKKADQLQSQKSSAQNEKNSLTDQLNSVISEMNDAKDKLTKKQEEIQQAEDQLVQAKVDEDTQYQSMKKRIKYMYENGNTQFLEILLESKNIGDFLNKADYVSQISAYDREMLQAFQNTVKQVQDKEAALQDEYDQLKTLQDTLIEKQNSVQQLLDEKNLQLADLEKQIGENAATLQALIKQAEEERLKQEQQAAAAKAAAEAAAAAARQQAAQQQQQQSTYVSGSSNVVVSGNGQFTNPCPAGYVSSTFGYRDFDSSFHKGLDLAAAEGSPTYAAAAGTVVIAGWSDSAGNWVVINHGNGLVTKYMHHSAICVTAGQTVQKGQQIGYVGNTGNSFGAHLHFQVEVNGSAVNPQSYL